MSGATSPPRNRWSDFWNAQTSALNSDLATRHTDRYGEELRLLFSGGRAERVLELGCGDGALISALGFDRADRYLGVDFSAAMLERFRVRHPALEVRESAGHSFETAERFDLIFSAATVQYFDRSMLIEHMDHAEKMLAPGGLVVCASVPWSRMRWAYARGDVARRPRRSFPIAAAAHIKRLVRDNMGYWHDLPEVSCLAAQQGFEVDFFGSLHYPYRFHFVLRRAADCD